jgi:Family of unknown function (DUF6353)
MLIGLTGLVRRAKYLVNDNSTTILTGMGVTGTVTTAYLSGRASFKAAQLLEQDKGVREELLSEAGNGNGTVIVPDLPLHSKVRLTWRLYIPAFGVGVTTITSIVMANKIASKKIAALAIASGISERALQEYKAKVVERFGERDEMKIRDELAQERVNKHPISSREVILAGTGEVLCYDQHSGRYFQSTVENIKRAENKINHDLNNFMHASLTEFYDEIGLPATSYSDSVGWNSNNQLEIAFSTVMSSNDQPCIAIDFINPPHANYRDLYD